MAYLDALEFAKGQQQSAAPAGMFPDAQIGRDLRYVARHLAYSKQTGARRQVYLVQDGGYDTHTGQLLTDTTNPGLERRLVDVADSVSALDASIQAYGMDGEVAIVIMSEFGRTLDPAAGGGSDHAWGNHWFVAGGAVAGGQVVGQLPSLKLGGTDDFDRAGEGRSKAARRAARQAPRTGCAGPVGAQARRAAASGLPRAPRRSRRAAAGGGWWWGRSR